MESHGGHPCISGLPEDLHNLAGKPLAVKRFDRGNTGNRVHMGRLRGQIKTQRILN